MQEEYDSIIKVLSEELNNYEDNKFQIGHCKYLNNDVYFMLSGIGKVNVAMHTQYMINKYSPDVIINVGVAGSLSEELTFGDVVIADDLVQHDVDVTAFGLPLGQIPRMDTFSFPGCRELLKKLQNIPRQEFKTCVGRIISGDKFINDKATAIFLSKHFGALACEMEGAAVAHVCYNNSVPFAIIRALSDMAGQEGEAYRSYNELKDMAALRSSYVVQHLLTQI